MVIGKVLMDSFIQTKSICVSLFLSIGFIKRTKKKQTLFLKGSDICIYDFTEVIEAAGLRPTGLATRSPRDSIICILKTI